MSVPMVDFDRFLFAFTIGSHILLVSLSIGLAIMICAVEFLSARSKDKYYAALARRLVRPFVVSFGIGTASGIVMAVELVNLFPGFMTLVSKTGVISIFYVEIFAFFLETVFLVVYVYYGRVFRGRYTRWLLTLPIVIGTLLSAVLIVMVNAWMNTPNGFDIGAYLATGAVTGVDPWAPFLTPSTGYEVFHVLATVPLTGIMMIGGFFAYRYYRSSNPDERTLFLKGLRITVALSLVLVVLSVLSGILQIENLYRYQPLKYAAMELNVNSGTDLPENVFGWLNGNTVVGAIQIPGLQGILSDHDNVPGLSQYPSSDWPPLIIHDTFDTMVLLGVLLGLFLFGVRRALGPEAPTVRPTHPRVGIRRVHRRDDGGHGARLDDRRARATAVDRLQRHDGEFRREQQLGPVLPRPRDHRGVPLPRSVHVLVHGPGVPQQVDRGRPRRSVGR